MSGDVGSKRRNHSTESLSGPSGTVELEKTSVNSPETIRGKEGKRSYAY